MPSPSKGADPAAQFCPTAGRGGVAADKQLHRVVPVRTRGVGRAWTRQAKVQLKGRVGRYEK